jgi:hypothetical protein
MNGNALKSNRRGSAWSLVRIFDFLVVNDGVITIQNQQSQPNPTQTIEATRLVII